MSRWVSEVAAAAALDRALSMRLAPGMGSISGDLLLSHYSLLRPALSFALPALFLSLLLSMLNSSTRLAVITSLILAAAFHWSGHSETGIIAAAFIGPGIGIICRKNQ